MTETQLLNEDILELLISEIIDAWFETYARELYHSDRVELLKASLRIQLRLHLR